MVFNGVDGRRDDACAPRAGDEPPARLLHPAGGRAQASTCARAGGAPSASSRARPATTTWRWAAAWPRRPPGTILSPVGAYEALRDHVAFYPGRVDACYVDDEQVPPQAGDFYGGWITERHHRPLQGRAGDGRVVNPAPGGDRHVSGEDGLLRDAAERAIRYRDGLGGPQGQGRRGSAGGAVRGSRKPCPRARRTPSGVIALLDEVGSPATTATAGPRFFGFVIGGSLPVTVAASWLATAWDQNAGAYVASPVAATLEHVAQGWLVDLLGLPETTVAGFVTGATMANFSALAAARHDVLAAAGWDVDERGLAGAPPLTVIVGEEAHPSLHKALGLLGIGRRNVVQRAGGRAGRPARRRPARHLRPHDRVPAGRQREHRRLRPVRARCARRRTRPAPGCTWTAPSACGRRRRRRARTSCAAWAPPTRGPPTRTSGSTSPTTAGWRSCATPSRCARPWA